jgi:hypothetical protein
VAAGLKISLGLQYYAMPSSLGRVPVLSFSRVGGWLCPNRRKTNTDAAFIVFAARKTAGGKSPADLTQITEVDLWFGPNTLASASANAFNFSES